MLSAVMYSKNPKVILGKLVVKSTCSHLHPESFLSAALRKENQIEHMLLIFT